jgi:CheY-like chemotaxis protein
MRQKIGLTRTRGAEATGISQSTYVVHLICRARGLLETDILGRFTGRKDWHDVVLGEVNRSRDGELFPLTGEGSEFMEQRIRALLVCTEDEPSHTLDTALQNLAVETHRARSCQEARNVLERASGPPDIVFTDTTLPDGTWKELLAMGRQMQVPSKIVVVATMADTRLYIDAMENGAFDFMLSPFASDDLAHVIRCATDKRPRVRAPAQEALVK